MQIALTSTGLIKPQAFDAWTRERQARIRRELAAVMRREGKSIAEAAQANARGALGGNKAWRSFRHKVYDNKPAELPALKIGSRVPWLGVHETGGSIRGPLLVPIIRIGPKAFRRVLREIKARGDGYWVKGRSGLPVLMAENLKEYGGALSKFKSAERKQLRAAGGKGRLRAGQDIPIATLIPQTRLRKRLRFEQTVRARIPGLIRQFEKAVG
ncbi:MAG TPA: DUF6441 family protein [Gallionella sp.]|nr:DUF6441 family protein [Gallionella sp.]